LGLDAGQIQPPESATEEHPGAEDSASDDMIRAAPQERSENQSPASASVNAEGGHFEQTL